MIVPAEPMLQSNERRKSGPATKMNKAVQNKQITGLYTTRTIFKTIKSWTKTVPVFPREVVYQSKQLLSAATPTHAQSAALFYAAEWFEQCLQLPVCPSRHTGW